MIFRRTESIADWESVVVSATHFLVVDVVELRLISSRMGIGRTCVAVSHAVALLKQKFAEKLEPLRAKNSPPKLTWQRGGIGSANHQQLCVNLAEQNGLGWESIRLGYKRARHYGTMAQAAMSTEHMEENERNESILGCPA